MRTFLFSLLLLLANCGESTTVAQNNDTNSSSSAQDTIAAESQRFIEWLDAEYAEELDFSPLLKTRQGDKSAHGELNDVSEAALDAQLQWRRSSVAQMRSNFDRDQLDKQGKLSWDLWEYILEDAQRSEPFRRHRYIFGRRGPQSALANSLINYQEVIDANDMGGLYFAPQPNHSATSSSTWSAPS